MHHRDRVTRNVAITSFWRRVKKTRRCWLWLGATNNGYGRVDGPVRRIFGTTVASRVAFFLTRRTLPATIKACHHCDNRLCVRPSHMFSGTQKQNIQDALRKGRMCHKLSNKQVREIRKSKVLNTLLAKKYNVHSTTIRAVRLKIHFRHVK